MDLNLLKIFAKVADCGSLTNASKYLNMPKSKLSRDLVKLEHEMEQTLLIRSPKGVIITEQGQQLLQSVRGQLEDIESSIDRLRERKDELKGTIRLTAPEDLSYFLLTPMITEFMEKYPDIGVELYSTNSFLDFTEYRIDLAFRIGKLEDSSLIQRKISDINVPLIAKTEYLKSNPRVKTLEDLHHHSVAIMRDLHGNPFNKEIEKYVTPGFSSNSIPVLMKYIAEGKGMATVPDFVCRNQLATKEYSVVFDSFVSSKRSLFLLTRPAKHIPVHVKIFKDYIFEKIGEQI